jgi:hypothetical protein
MNTGLVSYSHDSHLLAVYLTTIILPLQPCQLKSGNVSGGIHSEPKLNLQSRGNSPKLACHKLSQTAVLRYRIVATELWPHMLQSRRHLDLTQSRTQASLTLHPYLLGAGS